MPVEPFQAEVARLALQAAAGHDFALAGGNALIAHGLLSRPTEDVDLFSPVAGGPGAALQAVLAALAERGWQVRLLRDPVEHGGEFGELEVTGLDGRTTTLDLARDPRRHRPVLLRLDGQPCPVLDLQDALANKMGALLGRGLPRDYIDVAAALQQYDRGLLLELCFTADPGLRVEDAAHAAWALDDMPARRFTEYGLDAEEVGVLRERFADWPRDPSSDTSGHEAHHRAHAHALSAGVRAAALSYPRPATRTDAPPAPPPPGSTHQVPPGLPPSSRSPRLGG